MFREPRFDPFAFVGPLIGVIVLVLLIAGTFLILRALFSRGTTSQKLDSVKRGYYYLISFITLSVLFFAVSDLLSLILFTFFSTGSSPQYSYDTFARGIALRTATVIVALPVYFYHWLAALKRTETPDEEIRNYEIREKRGYTQVVMVLSTLSLLIFGVRFVYILLLFGLGVSGVTLAEFSGAVAYALPAFAIWMYHLKVLKETK